MPNKCLPSVVKVLSYCCLNLARNFYTYWLKFCRVKHRLSYLIERQIKGCHFDSWILFFSLHFRPVSHRPTRSPLLTTWSAWRPHLQGSHILMSRVLFSLDFIHLKQLLGKFRRIFKGRNLHKMLDHLSANFCNDLSSGFVVNEIDSKQD